MPLSRHWHQLITGKLLTLNTHIILTGFGAVPLTARPCGQQPGPYPPAQPLLRPPKAPRPSTRERGRQPMWFGGQR